MPETKPELTGRELDAAVCGLMEAKPEPYPDADLALERELDGNPVTSPCGWWVARCEYDRGDVPEWESRPVSTDLNWAMRAYGALHEQGWRITRVCHSARGCGVEMWCDHKRARAFVEPSDREPGVVLAEAICRAVVEAGR